MKKLCFILTILAALLVSGPAFSAAPQYQHDYNISAADANSGVTLRAAINAALQALASNNQGATEPATTYAYMWWADTTTGLLKRRNAANDGWITVISLTGTAQESAFPIAVAGGTADAVTANYTPDITLSDMRTVAFVALGANATTTPTFAPDGLTAHTIVKHGGSALAAGDIPGALAVCLVQYNLANIRWELLNPAVSGGGGSGDLIHSGTPTNHQWGVFTDGTHVKGVTVAGSKVACTNSDGEPLACTNLADVAYDPAGTAAGKIASSISDGDTTHSPDGNSVYDALAGKFAKSQGLASALPGTCTSPEVYFATDTKTYYFCTATNEWYEAFAKGANGSYYVGLGNNTSYTPVAGKYRYLFLNGVPTVDSNGTAKSLAYTDSNITGTAGNLSGTPALPNGTTATSQSQGAGDTKLATTAYVGTRVPVPYRAKASFNPQNVYDNDGTNHWLVLEPSLPAAITITKLMVICDVDPTTEPTVTFRECDAGIGCANASTIEAVTTSAGVATVTSSIDDASIAAGHKIIIVLSDPDNAILNMSVLVEGTY